MRYFDDYKRELRRKGYRDLTDDQVLDLGVIAYKGLRAYCDKQKKGPLNDATLALDEMINCYYIDALYTDEIRKIFSEGSLRAASDVRAEYYELCRSYNIKVDTFIADEIAFYKKESKNMDQSILYRKNALNAYRSYREVQLMLDCERAVLSIFGEDHRQLVEEFLNCHNGIASRNIDSYGLSDEYTPNPVDDVKTVEYVLDMKIEYL